MIEILLIDDEPELLEITYEQLLLNYKNINITKANSGNEAIGVLIKSPKFDLIISDYTMFNGNGIDLLKHKVAFDYPGYFILYTSHMNPEIPEKLIDHQFLGVIEKLNFNELFNCISKYIK